MIACRGKAFSSASVIRGQMLSVAKTFIRRNGLPRLSNFRLEKALSQRQISGTFALGPAEAAVSADGADVTMLDIRVGKIVGIEKHPDADSLYVEQVDLGEPEGPRTIVSGLVKYVSLEDMQNKGVIVLANLKARNMRGIKSHGMLLCASNEEHTAVEPLTPPSGAAIGERIYFGDNSGQAEAANPNQLQKKKYWEAVQPLLKTDNEKRADFKGDTMMTSVGPVTCATLVGANIS